MLKRIRFEPFLSLPKESNPAHVYSIKNGENSNEFQDTITIKDQLKSIILVIGCSLDPRMTMMDVRP